MTNACPWRGKAKATVFPACSSWLNFRFRGQLEIKILIVRDIFHINLKKNKLEPAIIWKLLTCQRITSKILDLNGSMPESMIRCLVPRPHYYTRPMRFGSRGSRKLLRHRQTRRSETFCLTWGEAFGSGRAVNNFSVLMKDVQQPWRVQRIKS